VSSAQEEAQTIATLSTAVARRNLANSEGSAYRVGILHGWLWTPPTDHLDQTNLEESLLRT
jgi:hypothetical protein